MQLAGTPFLVLIILGCACGSAASFLDSVSISPPLCRLRISLIYLFITLLLAARLGKLVSHCKRARMYRAVGSGGTRAMGWDFRARRAALALVLLQLVALGIYMGAAARAPVDESLLFTVCSVSGGELAFSGIEVGLLTSVLFACFGMLGWLQTVVRFFSAGSKDLLFSLVVLASAAGAPRPGCVAAPPMAWPSGARATRLHPDGDRRAPVHPRRLLTTVRMHSCFARHHPGGLLRRAMERRARAREDDGHCRGRLLQHHHAGAAVAPVGGRPEQALLVHVLPPSHP